MSWIISRISYSAVRGGVLISSPVRASRKPVIDVGDVMLDAFRTFTPDARRTSRRDFVPVSPFAIGVTIHRPSNTDDPERLARIVEALGDLGLACVWPVHPRLRERMKQLDLPANVHCVEPLSYFEMLVALEACRSVITDSGGLQKETYWAKKPCVTVRGETEWVETLDGGWNQLWDPVREIAAIGDSRRRPTTRPGGPFTGTERRSETHCGRRAQASLVMTNLLLIALEFPPIQAAGTFRPLRFLTHLPKFGIRPIVVTFDPDAARRWESACSQSRLRQRRCRAIRRFTCSTWLAIEPDRPAPKARGGTTSEV